MPQAGLQYLSMQQKGSDCNGYRCRLYCCISRFSPVAETRATGTLLHFRSDDKFYTPRTETRYAERALNVYQIGNGFSSMDDMMRRQSRFCGWVESVFALFDEAPETNFKVHIAILSIPR